MGKTTIGVDIGEDQVKFAVCDPGEVRRLAEEPLPDNLVRDGHIISPEAMSDFLRQAAAKHRVSGRKCAVVLPSTVAFTKRTVMPAMTVEQLRINLPYEFRDYITQEKDKYVYDYAVLDLERDGDGKPKQMELMAAACPKTLIREYMDMFRRAGFKLMTAAPEEFAYYNLLRRYEEAHPDRAGREHCIIDLGHRATRVHIFTGLKFEVSRVIEYGGATADAAIADELHVDEHIARTYKLSNHENAQELESCRGLYNAVALEITRAVNFYGYNNPDSALQTAWVCGGGVRNEAMMAQLRETLSLELEPIAGLLPPGGGEGLELCPAAIGITQ